MTFYEDSLVKSVCVAFTRWSGWGPPTSEYQVMEFCRAKIESEAQAKDYAEILTRWMNGEYSCKMPLWLHDD